MDLRPFDRVGPYHEVPAPVTIKTPPPRERVRVLGLAVLCIAAFECSQLVFQSSACPSWASGRAQIAAAGVVGPDTPGRV